MNMIKLIAGLGNPGGKYSNTRHNFGFRAVDRFAQVKNLSWKNWNDTAEITSYTVSERKVLIVKPMTFMNNSGIVISSVLKYYKIQPSEMFLLYDDYSIPLGQYKFRTSGSSGGHNGINSVINQTKFSDFPRMKLGMGPLPAGAKIIDFVLSFFGQGEKEKVDSVLEQIPEILDTVLELGFDKAVSKIANAFHKGINSQMSKARSRFCL